MVILSHNTGENMNLFERMAFNKQYTDTLALISNDPQKRRIYWDSIVKKYLPNLLLDNFTDFSDSFCYTYFIGCDNLTCTVGSQELIDYLNAGNDAYYVKLQISFRAPILCAIFCKYEKSPTALQTSEEPFTKSQQIVYSSILQFADENNLHVVKYADLCTMVVDTAPNEHTAYNYLFEPEI